MVLARVPAWDLERHGCSARAYKDVLAACPTPVRVQAPAVDRSFYVAPADLTQGWSVCGVGWRRGAASGVGTRRKYVHVGSVAASMPPHGPAPGRGTMLPVSLVPIGKRWLQYALQADPAVARPGACMRRRGANRPAGTSSASAAMGGALRSVRAGVRRSSHKLDHLRAAVGDRITAGPAAVCSRAPRARAQGGGPAASASVQAWSRSRSRRARQCQTPYGSSSDRYRFVAGCRN